MSTPSTDPHGRPGSMAFDALLARGLVVQAQAADPQYTAPALMNCMRKMLETYPLDCGHDELQAALDDIRDELDRFCAWHARNPEDSSPKAYEVVRLYTRSPAAAKPSASRAPESQPIPTERLRLLEREPIMDPEDPASYERTRTG